MALILGAFLLCALFVLGAVTDPLTMYKLDVFTLPPSLAGVPALATPCGLSAAGLPIGLQLTAPWFEEARLVRLGHAFEQVTGFGQRARLPGEG